MISIKNFFKAIGHSKVFWLLVCGLVLLTLNELHISHYWTNRITLFIDESEILLHLGVAFFIAIILEVVNEKEIREKIAGGAKESMKETLSQVVKLLTKSDEIGKALDSFIDKCKDFYRNNYEIEFRVSKKSEGIFLIEIDSRYEIINQTNEDKNYHFRYGGDSKSHLLKELYLDRKKVDPLPEKIEAERHGILGYEYTKEIRIPKGSGIEVRFLSSVETDIKDKSLHTNTFGSPVFVKSLKIVLDKDCGIRKEQIKVLSRGTPNVIQKFDLEYTFDCCFLPGQSIHISVLD